MMLSLLLFAGAAFFWIKGNNELQQRRARQPETVPQEANRAAATNAGATPPVNAMPSSLLSTPSVQSAINQSLSSIAARKSSALVSPSGFTDARFRLSNTAKSLDELVRDDRAILMRNALIDTSAEAPEIPAALQNEGESSSYIVQAKSAPGAQFRAELANAGASIVSYVPNNAYLVQATADAAQQLRASPSVQAVLPYEPYYKLSQRLLELAVTESDLPVGATLRVTFFPGQRENGIQAIRQLGVSVVGEESSPFGPQVLIEPPSDVLPGLARLGAVQGIEPEYRRKPASDLTRVQIGLAEDTVTNANYLNLTGSNIWVNINDSGIDATHGDLKGRVFSPFVNLLRDTNGHGTFVAGILAGDGKGSSSVNGTNGYISATNANYRGMAPLAKLFELPLDFFPEVNLRQSDTYLQETAASTNYLTLKRTNSLISNNSWVYDGSIDYDSAAARYDAAVRDALPGLKGAQEIAYVFPAGNNGFGNDDGSGGEPGLISSPGTAKNVITVGALEHARFITNFFTNIVATTDEMGSNIFVTNQITPYFTATDSSNEVASFSSRGNVGIGIEGTFGRFKPDVVAPGSFVIAARSTNWVGNYDTNTPEGAILSTLNTNLGAYRFDSGTTYAVPVVSGMMALFQEFFETKAKEKRTRLSPALMKALVINGARSASSLYDVSPRTLLNEQGWGLVNIQRSLPALLGQTNAVNGPIQLIDQSPTNALSTGQARTWAISLNTNGVGFPLRATLVWSDPPGNPNVGVKLVNDLDLIITNLESGYVFYGNDIESGTDFTTPTPPDVDGLPDSVNNVENVFIQNPRAFGTNFTITVRARKVNVNAVPGYQSAGGSGSDIVQDFALVIASDNTIGTNAFKSFGVTNAVSVAGFEPLTRITNGLPLLNQRVGANPLLLGANGAVSQWRFYTFTNVTITNEFNSLTNGSNVAFVTFAPPNLSVSRTLEADIDLYVSRDPLLTNLNTTAIANAWKSTNEGGTEFVILTNAPYGEDIVYYIGVKSEDQQAAEFSLMGVSSDQPFQKEQNGRIILQGYPISQVIPDGSPKLPGGTVVLALGLDPRRIATIQASELISHQDLGDLFGNLSHNRTFAVLNNHTRNEGFFSGTNLLIYDDTLLKSIPGTTNGYHMRTGPSDGPGTLLNFVGKPLIGPWFLTMVDNSPSLTGRVENLQITLTPLRDLKDGIGVGSVNAGESVSYALDIPAGATNMVVTLTKGAPPLRLFLGLDGVPVATNSATYQAVGTNVAGIGVQLQYSITNAPPLQPGATYYLTIFNPSNAPIDYELRVRFEIDFNPSNHSINTLTNAVAILEDAVTNSIFTVKDDRLVADASVGVRINYPRISDLLLTLTSPQGTRIVLAENRGGATASAYGTTFSTNRMGYTIFTEDTNVAKLPIKFASPPFFDSGATNGIIMTNGFDDVLPGVYPVGKPLGKWINLSNTVAVLANTNANTPSHYVELRSGAISTNLTTVSNREYELQFVYRRGANVLGAAAAYGTVQIDGARTNSFYADSSGQWATNKTLFVASQTNTAIRFAGDGTAIEIDTVTVRETGSRSYLPEESLTLLKSERAYGDWRLDLYDTRSNLVVNGSLISWYLNLDYANPTTSAVVINSGAASQYKGTIKTNQVNYFVVDPCDNTTDITIILTGVPTGTPLILSADRSGFPTGNPLTDDYAPLLNDQTGNIATLHLTTNSPAPAPLIQGRPIYLTVQNLEADATNTFTLTARFSPTPKCVLETKIRLQSEIPFASALAAEGDGEADAFLLQPSASASTLTLNLSSPANADLGILVKRGSVPTPDSYDYKQDFGGASAETLALSGLDLTSDPWYAVVYNNSGFATPYTILQTETSGLEFIHVDLANGNVNLTFATVAGSSYTVQSSSDLVNWSNLASLTATGDSSTVNDSSPPLAAKFYRVVKVNP
jgi:subtilisin-like proprotein convertase family protein